MVEGQSARTELASVAHHILARSFIAVSLILGIVLLFIIASIIADIRPYEQRPLLRLLGWQGLATCLSLLAAYVLLLWMMAVRALRNTRVFHGTLARRAVGFFLVLNALLVIGMAQWVFFEQAPSARFLDRFVSEEEREAVTAVAVERFSADGSLGVLRAVEPGGFDQRAVALMLARISINRPSVFGDISIGETIVRYADQYEVHPYLLLHWCYIDSFYGEAPSGPMPFFSEINGEMFRDLVQAHLPSWFIESRIRIALIEGAYLGWVLPDSIASKVRYALQKATYDIAIAPYMNSVMSDLLLVFSVYGDEFTDSNIRSDPVWKAFERLEGNALLPPYHDPLAHEKKGEEYYDRYRDALVDFGRAAVYKLGEDFEFATQVQALVAHYYSRQYAQRIGDENWRQISERQRTALLAMLRDVYVPNIGKTSYNLYAVPEFNTTPINFLASEVRKDIDQLVAPGSGTWKPKDEQTLWGATGLMLRVLTEVWFVTTGEGLSGVNPASTVEDVPNVLVRNHFN